MSKSTFTDDSTGEPQRVLDAVLPGEILAHLRQGQLVALIRPFRSGYNLVLLPDGTSTRGTLAAIKAHLLRESRGRPILLATSPEIPLDVGKRLTHLGGYELVVGGGKDKATTMVNLTAADLLGAMNGVLVVKAR